MDSSTISLCLSLFDWAKYKTSKGAIKMHTLLDYDGNLSTYVNITNGKTADNKGAMDIPLVKGSVVVADRFYNDFTLPNIWDSNQVFFVVRHKKSLQYTVIKELYLPGNRHQHVLKDEIIELKNAKYTKRLRRVAIWNEEREFVIELITNQIPKLFCDFPLIGTEEFHFPVVVNSFFFNPQTERDGIWLKGDTNKKVLENTRNTPRIHTRRFCFELSPTNQIKRYVVRVSERDVFI